MPQSTILKLHDFNISYIENLGKQEHFCGCDAAPWIAKATFLRYGHPNEVSVVTDPRKSGFQKRSWRAGPEKIMAEMGVLWFLSGLPPSWLQISLHLSHRVNPGKGQENPNFNGLMTIPFYRKRIQVFILVYSIIYIYILFHRFSLNLLLQWLP